MGKEKDSNTQISMGNLYDINKNIMKQEKPINKPLLENARPQLEKWFNQTLDGYAMLLCRERYDFTVFHLYEKQNPNPPKVAVSELFDCLRNRGSILSIEKSTVQGNAWEIWLKIDNEAFVYFLFCCDDWVIEC